MCICILTPVLNIDWVLACFDAMHSKRYQAFPKAGTITTLKMRMQFQGQPDKDGDLTAVHKDYVIIPAGTSALYAGRSTGERGSTRSRRSFLS